MSPPLRKASPPPRIWLDRTMPLKLAILIAAVLSFFQISGWISDALDLQGFARGWSFVIVLTSAYLGHGAWRAARKRKKAIKHEKWMAGLGVGFAENLEKARKEARGIRSHSSVRLEASIQDARARGVPEALLDRMLSEKMTEQEINDAFQAARDTNESTAGIGASRRQGRL